MNTYEVVRKGICITCMNLSTIYLGEYEAETGEEAIEEALDTWSYENFGQGGAMTEKDVAKEDSFLEGKFEAEIIHEE